MIDNAIRERVKEYYETHRISLYKLADQSLQIFNARISVDQLKHWSSEDGGWKKPSIEDTQKLNIIAEKIFETIEETERLDAKDLVALASVYLSYATKRPPDQIGDNRPSLQQIIDAVNKK